MSYNYNPILEHPDNTRSKEEYDGRTLLIRFNWKNTTKKEFFEAFGFTFEDISDEIINLVCEGKRKTNLQSISCPLHGFSQAILPNGWKMEKFTDTSDYWFIIIDEYGNKRGNYREWGYQPGQIDDYTGIVQFFPKFRTTRNYVGDSFDPFAPVLISVKDSNNNILFTAGEAQFLSEKYYKLVAAANDYLKKNYPECEEDYYSGFFHTRLDKYWD